MDLSIISSGRAEMKPSAIHVPALLQEVTNGLRTIAKDKRTDLQIGLIEPDLTVWADRDRITQGSHKSYWQCYTKFTPAQGKVIVSAHTNGDAWAQVSIVDTGPGIPCEETKEIF